MKQITFIDRKTGALIHENPPGERFLRFMYHSPFGKLALNAVVKRKALSQLYGRLMNRPASKKNILPFVRQFGINLEEAIKPVEEFSSFNDFFYRKLRPNVRPIGQGFVSPADGKLIAFETISDISSFFVKGLPFTVASFLKNKDLAAQYQDASMILVRLAPNDYHRFHFPTSGQASAAQKIKGRYLSVSPYAVTKQFTRVFCENKREYTILASRQYGDVIVSPVGATMVGTIVETYKPNAEVKKGEEMGYFAFGGSSVLMLINKSKITIDADLLENTRNGMETAVLMGETIGQ
ncbi:MAG: archaetidylserine decarboxylase [Bacteroidia bacterium]|nr:archaetidylserine decarboxylase [Bacteroidia bacterium]